MPTYSFGQDSPVKFEISDQLAELYNEAVDQFFKAQRRFVQKFGREWDPVLDNTIKPKWNRKQRKAWNEFARVFKRVIEEQGPFHENDFMDDFLVLNTASVASGASLWWGRCISLAATSGALYGLLKG